MPFTVAVGSGAAIIPCGRLTGGPYTQLSIRTARAVHVGRAKKVSSESEASAGEAQARVEIVDERMYYKFINSGLLREEPDFWEGPQWDWLGFLFKYLWLIGFPLGVIGALYGSFTFHEPPKSVKLAHERLYSVQSGDSRDPVDSVESESVGSDEVFEEPGAYDSDVFDSNPTEVAPSLE